MPATAGVNDHSLRRTFASLVCEAGGSPAYVMAQMGHTTSALALEVYPRMMERERAGRRLRYPPVVRSCGNEWGVFA